MNALMVNMNAIKMLNVKTREDHIHALAGQDSKETAVHVRVFDEVLTWSFPFNIMIFLIIFKFTSFILLTIMASRRTSA